MEKAIKRSIEGGYKYYEEILIEGEYGGFWISDGNGAFDQVPKAAFLLDHLIEGKDVNSFFDNLLK